MHLLRPRVNSLRTGALATEIEVHVVDNASCGGSAEMVQSNLPGMTLIHNRENLGSARANNQSWRLSRGRDD